MHAHDKKSTACSRQWAEEREILCGRHQAEQCVRTVHHQAHVKNTGRDGPALVALPVVPVSPGLVQSPGLRLGTVGLAAMTTVTGPAPVALALALAPALALACVARLAVRKSYKESSDLVSSA